VLVLTPPQPAARILIPVPIDEKSRRRNQAWSRSKTMKTLFSRFVKDESGATAIEYGLIASLIAIAIIAGAGALGNKMGNTFNYVEGKLKS
jgi:pilus assembly protein Flp/PilA